MGGGGNCDVYQNGDEIICCEILIMLDNIIPEMNLFLDTPK